MEMAARHESNNSFRELVYHLDVTDMQELVISVLIIVFQFWFSVSLPKSYRIWANPYMAKRFASDFEAARSTLYCQYYYRVQMQH